MADMLGGLLALVQASTCAVPYPCRLCWGRDKGNPEFVMVIVYDGCSTAPIFTALGSANRSSVSRSSPTGQQVYPPIHCGLQRGIVALPQSPFYLLNASPTTSHTARNAVCPGSGSLQADLRPGANFRSIHPPEFFCVPSTMPMQHEAYNGTYDMPVPHFAHGTMCRFIRALDATPSA
ncbi:hypothetical protein COCMIDRAFT_36724 [Bipolaris oryzae ATCC 44560]|uniref:Secreted protein n=1 Tax=Bipolaris oryzae ATCC 44560 TaxID=930090 RepID=W6ZPJ9_COCMI|nr:uncharacterized protein COCMIDRAFT_36724 [Bipolaris oryzae ATCC 44560]EUC45536.1 hypothetical protein COCMIDRAFT_36724 [Bipolaris oryzae ATCC 44560]